MEILVISMGMQILVIAVGLAIGLYWLTILGMRVVRARRGEEISARRD